MLFRSCSGGQDLEFGRRTVALRDRVGFGQDLPYEVGKIVGCDQLTVDDDPLSVADQVRLGRLAHSIPSFPQDRRHEGLGAALPIRAADEYSR